MQTRISVVIVTRNRSAELAGISLPSLARQTCPPTQVLLWDASDDDATRDASEAMRASMPMLTSARAPRRGICSQRNDAIPHCTGDVILFLDDDAELLPEALQQISLVFEADGDHHIAGCQCTLIAGTRWRNRTSGPRWFLAHLYRTVFVLDTFSRHQRFLPSGHTTGTEPLPEAKALTQATQGGCEQGLQWMWGGCTAWRRDVFNLPGIRFDEDLQLTSPYAFLEDLMLSRQVLRTTSLALVRARAALCVHHETGGGRSDLLTFGRMYGFNYWLVWHKQVHRSPASVLAFLWSQIGLSIGFAARDLVSGRRGRVQGLIQGWRDIRDWTDRRTSA
jgi:glycosyltransferase involved in cell wall biosynthesis